MKRLIDSDTAPAESEVGLGWIHIPLHVDQRLQYLFVSQELVEEETYLDDGVAVWTTKQIRTLYRPRRKQLRHQIPQRQALPHARRAELEGLVVLTPLMRVVVGTVGETLFISIGNDRMAYRPESRHQELQSAS